MQSDAIIFLSVTSSKALHVHEAFRSLEQALAESKSAINNLYLLLQNLLMPGR